MNADNELLELAAKAAGAEVNGFCGSDPHYAMPIEDDEGTTFPPWNPLTDDGDALRLAVTLDIDVTKVRHAQNYKNDLLRMDKHAATRRAIVRAAAEIGKAMK